MASRYKPNERVLMQAAELLRRPYYTDEPTAWVLALIARRVEQLALIADDRALRPAGRPITLCFGTDIDLSTVPPLATA
jgi:hypothetical protein